MQMASSVLFLAEPDDDMKCLICLDVARDPLQHEACGRLFCRQCLEENGKDQPCPNCRGEESHYYVDNRSKRAIEALKVHCSNVDADVKCDWEGTFGELEVHLSVCKFAVIPCPKECKDEDGKPKQVIRKDLDKHLKADCPFRELTCEYCNKKGTFAEISVNHFAVCPKVPVSCSWCDQPMLQCELEKHEKLECELAPIACKYRKVGCEVEPQRKNMVAHEEESKQAHLDMAMGKLEEANLNLESFKKETKEKVFKLETRAAALFDIAKSDYIKILLLENKHMMTKQFVMAFSIYNFQRKKMSSTSFTTRPFYTCEKGYNLALNVDTNHNKALSVYVKVLCGLYDSELAWPFVGEVTVMILDRLEESNHYSKTIDFTASDNMRPGGSSCGYPQFITLQKYIFNDALHFRVYFKAECTLKVP